ncbi:MAG: phosphate ABC transporter substrate-binding protein PstS [Actinomycetota bacterium]
MKGELYSNWRRGAAALAARALVVAACGDDDSSDSSSEGIQASGSSAMGAAMAAWVSEYNRIADASFEYAAIGSGGGRDQFLEGITVFAGSDVPLNDEEYAASVDRCAGDQGAVNLPHFVSAIAVFYNLPEIEGEQLNLPNDVLAKIFQGDITNWSDEEIAAANPDLDLPDRSLEAIVRNDDSGTTENFTEYLDAAAPGVWTGGVFGEWSEEGPSGVGSAQFTEGVVAAVAAGEGSIGYADLGQIGNLPAAAIGVADGFAPPTADGASAVFAASERLNGNNELDFAYELNRTPDSADVYPLSFVAYHIVCVEYDDADTAAQVRDFMTFVGSEDGQQIAEELAGSTPLSNDLRNQLAATIDAIGP